LKERIVLTQKLHKPKNERKRERKNGFFGNKNMHKRIELNQSVQTKLGLHEKLIHF
jgi:hypothetical protein